jgi:hypothetical protein
MPSRRNAGRQHAARGPGRAGWGICLAVISLGCLWLGGCFFGKDHPEYDQRITELNKASQELQPAPSTTPSTTPTTSQGEPPP